jgi:ankyrin repeat protein
MISCVEGHEGVVKLVLDREDTDIRLKDKDGKTAYDYCSTWIREDVKQRLLV